jgi:hypothetical protein
MGRTDGECIESICGEAKQADEMTKEMNTGHRHDTLNDFFNDWNRGKAQKLSVSKFVNEFCLTILCSCAAESVI